jgi:hypothetical protein
MLQTLQLMSITQPKKVENIVNNSVVVERESNPPYFILNTNKNIK